MEDNHIIKSALEKYAISSKKFNHSKLSKRCSELADEINCNCDYHNKPITKESKSNAE